MALRQEVAKERLASAAAEAGGRAATARAAQAESLAVARGKEAAAAQGHLDESRADAARLASQAEATAARAEAAEAALGPGGVTTGVSPLAFAALAASVFFSLLLSLAFVGTFVHFSTVVADVARQIAVALAAWAVAVLARGWAALAPNDASRRGGLVQGVWNGALVGLVAVCAVAGSWLFLPVGPKLTMLQEIVVAMLTRAAGPRAAPGL